MANGRDIFNFNPAGSENYVFQDSGTKFMISGAGELALVQSWTIDYRMQMTPVYECGTSNVYWSIKHAAGQFQCSRILAGDYDSVGSVLGKPCCPKSPIITAGGGTCDSKGCLAMQLNGSVMDGVQFSGQAQNAYIGMNVSSQFVWLSIDKSNECQTSKEGCDDDSLSGAAYY